MKNIFKKSIIFAFIALSMLTFLVFSASAEDGGAVDQSIYYCREELLKLNNSKALIYAYDSIVAGVEESKTEITVYDGKNSISAKEIETVIDAYRRDYVQHFWLDNTYQISYNSQSVVKIIFNYTMSGKELKAARAEFESEVKKILDGIDPSMNDFQKELYLHDTLVSRVIYKFGAEARNSYGAIVKGEAVCEGYSEAFQYLLQRAGIRSLIITGLGASSDGDIQPHAWNCVEIDGKFYHTDPTWNDSGDGGFHAYFNISDKTIKEDHAIDDTAFALPVCASEDLMYFKIMGGYLDSYNKDLLTMILSNGARGENTLSARIYIPGNINTFMNWFLTNAGEIGGKVGIEGQFSISYYYLGREFNIILQGEISGETALPAEITDASISVGSDLTMKFYITPDKYSDLDKNAFYVLVTMCGKTVKIESFTEKDGKYVFSFDGIAPQLMSELIDIELFNSGVRIDGRKGYSVKENAQAILNAYKDDTRLVNFISDMLRYGAACQIYIGYKTNELATDGVVGMSEESDKPIDSTDKKTVYEDAVNDVYFTSVGVWFDNVNKLYVKLSSPVGARIVIKIGDRTVGVYENIESDTVYTGEIYASNFNEVYTFELYDNGVLVQTLYYSVSSYCNSLQNDQNVKISGLARALYNYGCSAAEWRSN